MVVIAFFYDEYILWGSHLENPIEICKWSIFFIQNQNIEYFELYSGDQWLSYSNAKMDGGTSEYKIQLTFHLSQWLNHMGKKDRAIDTIHIELWYDEMEHH